jgi:hypothetical protein
MTSTVARAGDTTLRVARLDGGELLLDGIGLAEAFFSVDPSSIAEGAYDSHSSSTGMIGTADVFALNRTMRARTPHTRWQILVDAPLPWLGAIPIELDLVDTPEDVWEEIRAPALIEAALLGVVGPGRGVSVTTKMLHLKRPRLFPILDELVLQLLGAGISPDASPETRALRAAQVVLHLRREGLRNAKALRRINSALAETGLERSLVRILDAVLWLSHPAAGGVRRTFECRPAAPSP